METNIIGKKQDLTHLHWSKIRHSSGTAGSFLKAYSVIGGKKLYYKLSNYDSVKGVIGIESVHEIIVDRLLTLFGVEHLSYRLIHADIMIDEKVTETYVCVSEDFKNPNEDKMPLDNFYDIEHQKGEDRLSFCIRYGWEDYIYNMFVIDFLILNRDRHGANIEVLRNRKTHTLRLAPLFDHGLSFLFSCSDEESIQKFDVLEDKKVNSYLGSCSAKDNLSLIPKEKLPKFYLKERDKKLLFQGLIGVLPDTMREKIWEMIVKRWKYYEDFCNSRR